MFFHLLHLFRITYYVAPRINKQSAVLRRNHGVLLKTITNILSRILTAAFYLYALKKEERLQSRQPISRPVQAVRKIRILKRQDKEPHHRSFYSLFFPLFLT